MADQQLTEAQNTTYIGLTSMGFPANQSATAAAIFGSNIDEAVNYLLDNSNLESDNLFQTTQQPTQNPTYDANYGRMMPITKEIPVTAFRISYISRLLLSGFFHDLLIHTKIFPSDIQNVMLQYTNLLFAKLQYNIDDTQNGSEQKVDENDIHYLAFETDITLGEIALSIEKRCDYKYDEEDDDTAAIDSLDEQDELYQSVFKKDEIKKIKEYNYPQFIHLWLRYRDIHFIYDKKAEISDTKWLELPADYEHKSLNVLDQEIDNENVCVEIAVEKYDQSEKHWPFSKEVTIDLIKEGDIIDAYRVKDDKWYESVVKCVYVKRIYKGFAQIHFRMANVHYIGLNSAKDEALLAQVESRSTVEDELILPRGTHTNGPDRGNWWRKHLYVGYKIDIFDIAYRKWYSGEIVEIDETEGKVKAHYDGYSGNYDEWIDTESDRLAPLNTHTAPDPFWSTFYNKQQQ